MYWNSIHFIYAENMKIKDLNSELIEQLVELECNNILPVLHSVGLNLTPQHMREQLDFFRESDVVISEESSINMLEGLDLINIKMLFRWFITLLKTRNRNQSKPLDLPKTGGFICTDQSLI